MERNKKNIYEKQTEVIKMSVEIQRQRQSFIEELQMENQGETQCCKNIYLPGLGFETLLFSAVGLCIEGR